MEAVAGGVLGLVTGLGFGFVIARISTITSRVERKLDVLIRHVGIDLPKLAAEEAAALNRAGKKIEAIKVYRELTGCGLAEAKAKVESLG